MKGGDSSEKMQLSTVQEAFASEREVQVVYYELLDLVYGHFRIFQLILLGILLMSLTGNWLIFQKLGEPGWKGIVPFYNLYILFEKLYGNGLYVLAYLVCFIPLIGGLAAFAVSAYTAYRLARSFRKDTAYALGLILCGPLFRILLGMDRGARYHHLPPLELGELFH